MDTLGVVESKSIAAGVMLADGMVKAAGVELVRAGTICAGRYLIFVAGQNDAVATSVAFARNSSYSLSGSFVISHISTLVTAALKQGQPGGPREALGVVECRNVSAGLAAADIAVKRSSVRLLKLVAGQGIMGKSYFVLGGDVSSVNEAVEAAKNFLTGSSQSSPYADATGQRIQAGVGHTNQLIEAVVLPTPDEAVVRALTGRLG